MITTNVYQRVFYLKYANSIGTAFTIDIDDRQYLVTARHVVAGIEAVPAPAVSFLRGGAWLSLPVTVVWAGTDAIDIAVLATGSPISPTFALPADNMGMVFGQDMYFLGFPYNLFTDFGEINNGYPLAFVKRALLSASARDGQGGLRLYLDGHNNRGFSGGPVIFSLPGTVPAEYKVCGVISGYLSDRQPILHAGQVAAGLTWDYNTGIIVANDIKHAVEAIRKNSIGPAIS